MFKPKVTLNYPVREEPAQPALPRRACAAPLSQRRGALHRLQAVRGDLPGAGHHHRGRAARRRHPAHDALRHRHDQVHLLRLLRGGLPGRRHRRGPELRVRDETREELFYDKDKLLANGDRWEARDRGQPRRPTRPTAEAGREGETGHAASGDRLLPLRGGPRRVGRHGRRRRATRCTRCCS